MHQCPAVLSQATIHHAPQFWVVVLTHVLKHAHRHKRIVLASDISIVIQHIGHTIGVAFRLGALRSVLDLLRRYVPRRYRHTIVQCHVPRQSTPTAAGFGNPITRAQLKFATNMIHLGLLRHLDSHLFFGKIGAGVLHFFVQPQPIEIVTDIVVMMDVFPGAVVGVRAGFALLYPFNHTSNALRLGRSEGRNQQRDQVSFNRNTAA